MRTQQKGVSSVLALCVSAVCVGCVCWLVVLAGCEIVFLLPEIDRGCTRDAVHAVDLSEFTKSNEKIERSV